MRVTLTLLIFFQTTLSSAASSRLGFAKKYWNLNSTEIELYLKGKPLALSKVSSDDKTQSFKFKAIGLHPRKCTRALMKISMLEEYQKWIGFIKVSRYNEKAKLFTVKADHTLLPSPMWIHILVERPSSPGTYPFTFPTGMFKGLKGKFIIENTGKHCALFSKASWQGPKTSIPNIAIEIFSETLAKLGAEILIRKSK